MRCYRKLLFEADPWRDTGSTTPCYSTRSFASRPLRPEFDLRDAWFTELAPHSLFFAGAFSAGAFGRLIKLARSW